jgi:integrase/recombinase XerC
MTNQFLNYIQYEKRYSNHTLISYKTDLRQFQEFLEANYPNVPIHEVSHPILRGWMIHLSELGLNEVSINRKLVTIRTFYKFLQKKSIISSNPSSRILNLKTKKRLPQFVRDADMKATLDKEQPSDEFSVLRDQLVVELLYGTGIRLNELVTLPENRVDLAGSTIKVTGKRNKDRIIPVTHLICTLIKKYIAAKNETFNGNASPYLIVSNNGTQSYPMMINRIVKRYLQGASVDKKNPHILRHTYATHLLEKGADLNAVKDLLGHQSLAATQVYTHNSLGKLKNVFDQAHPKA